MPAPDPVPENDLPQLVDALQALRTQGRRPIKKVSPAIFKDILPGRKPDPHLLKANEH